MTEVGRRFNGATGVCAEPESVPDTVLPELAPLKRCPTCDIEHLTLNLMVKAYLLSLPERLVRSVLGLGAGVAREVGEVAVPAGIRRGQLRENGPRG